MTYAQGAPSGASVLRKWGVLHMKDQDKLSPDCVALVRSLQDQVDAMNRMIQNNQHLIALMAEMLANMSDDGEEIQPVKAYLDGSPLVGK